MKEYKVGDRINVPVLDGVRSKERKGTVLEVYKTYYLVLVDQGYKECFLKSDFNKQN